MRQLAITLLNDEDGINYPAWELLSVMLKAEGHTDIIQAIDMANGKVFLSEEAAANL